MAKFHCSPEEKDFLKRLWLFCNSQEDCGNKIRELLENVPTSIDISGFTNDLSDPLPIFHHWED